MGRMTVFTKLIICQTTKQIHAIQARDIKFMTTHLCLSSWKNFHNSKLMVYRQLNRSGFAGSAVGKPPLSFLVACVVYVFDVYDSSSFKWDYFIANPTAWT